MTDFPILVGPPPPAGVLSALNEGGLDLSSFAVVPAAGALVANTAYFCPVMVTFPLTVYQMAMNVTATSASNVDVGIYDYLGNRLVSAGVTAITGSAVPQIFNVTDTSLNPGIYYIAGWCSSATPTFSRIAPNAFILRGAACVQQTAQASGLPATATFAAGPAAMPIVFASFTAGALV